MNALIFILIVVLAAGVGFYIGHLLGYLSGKGETCRNCLFERGEPPTEEDIQKELIACAHKQKG